MTVLFFPTASVRGVVINLQQRDENEPVTVSVSGNDANRIEFPETVMNAFSSRQSIDVRIVDRSALVRTREPAELIVLTEKRRLTLMLLPEDIPSRTVIISAGEDESHEEAERSPAESRGEKFPSAWEKRITDLLLLSLRQSTEPLEGAEKKKISGSLFLYPAAGFADGDLAVGVYSLENTAGEEQRISERMFSELFPRTVAVGIDRNLVPSGESARVFVVTERKAGR